MSSLKEITNEVAGQSISPEQAAEECGTTMRDITEAGLVAFNNQVELTRLALAAGEFENPMEMLQGTMVTMFAMGFFVGQRASGEQA